MSDLLKKLNKETMFRAVEFDRAAIDAEARTAEVAFSSEEPYQRWFGTEILGHSAEEVEMKFLTSGKAPLLAGHDHRDQIGVIEKAWIDPDRKGRAIVRFGKSARAEEYFQDIMDGIRGNVSVGYRVQEMKLVRSDKDKGDTFRVTKWTPLEASIVAIPADLTVGIGREFEEEAVQPQPIEVKQMEENKVAPEIDVEKITVQARKAETDRVRDIMALGKMHKLDDEAGKAVENGKSVDEFRVQVLEAISKRQPAPVEVQKNTEIGMSKKEVKQYSILRLVRAMVSGDWREAEFEKECSVAFEDQTGRRAKGAFIPPDITNDNRFMQRDLVTNVGTAGGYMVAENLLSGSFIDMLRNRTAVMQMGARMLSGLVGDADIPKQTGGATAYWVNEGGTLTESQQTLGQIRLSPKTIGCYTDITRRMMLQSSMDVENFVRADFAAQMAIAIDLAAIQGTAANGQPRGILNTTGTGSVTLNAANVPDWGDIVDLETAVAVDNALMGTLGYLTNATIVGNMKQTEKASTTGMYIFADGALNGYPCVISNNVPAKYILFGNWADLIIGMWSGLDVTVDKTTLGTSGGTRIICFQDLDIAIRHAESFAVGYKA